MKKDWLKIIKAENKKTHALVLETQKMADLAQKEANEALERVESSKTTIQKYIDWHDIPLWKIWFGIK